MAFVAQYRGTCGLCDEPIKPGETCEYTVAGAIVHAPCPEPTPTEIDMQPGETVCTKCFLVHTGECF